MLKSTGKGALTIIALVAVFQLLPFGHEHTNPPVQAEPQWDSQQTRDLAVRACFDCHSNETVWPWYSNVAPVSWLIQRDVDSGRRRLNFSQWGQPQRGAREAARTVQRGDMPPSYYLLLHPDANLSAAEKQVLETGLSPILGQGNGSLSQGN